LLICWARPKGYTPDSTADVFTGIQKVVSAVHAQVPDANIVVFAIFPRGPEVTNQRVNEVNALLPSLNKNNLVKVININSVFQNKDGTFRAACFKQDQLHLTPEGYDAWAKKLSQLLISKCALGSLPENSKKILSN
jgi:lysophospholipase L1-like esterase